MQTAGNGEHNEDQDAQSGATDVEPEEQNTSRKRDEKSDPDAPLQERPEAPNAKNHTNRSEVGGRAVRRRQNTHGSQLRSDRKDREQDVREHEDREVRSERGRMQQTQGERVGHGCEQRADGSSEERARHRSRESGEKVGRGC